MQIVNPQGVWIRNNSVFPMHDPESNTTYRPGVPMKVTETSWLAGQPTVELIDDPTAPAAPAEAPKQPAKGSK